MNNQSKTSLELDLSNEELIKIAVDNGEGVIASNGALSTVTGERTGRSPVSYTHLTLPTTSSV